MLSTDDSTLANVSPSFIRVENSDIFVRVYTDHTRDNLDTLLGEIRTFRENWPNVLQTPPLLTVYSDQLDDCYVYEILDAGCFYFCRQAVGGAVIKNNSDFVDYVKKHVLV